VVSVFLYLLQFPSYDVINDVIMSDADCIPGREPRIVAASLFQGVTNNASAVTITATIRSVSGNSMCADCSAQSEWSMH